MKISQKTLRTTKRLLSDIKEDQYFLLGLKITNEIEEILVNKLGISRAELNKAVLPSPLIGINSMRNADGEYITDKTRDKEIAYRALDWTLTARNGHTYSGTNYVP
ncbi:hypothetical protein [Macrococcus capreoli]|uniref:hypothetical protein n=1 Tax=Macrococcus capreoli TaxID=2982690 RepID=UPI003EE80C50